MDLVKFGDLARKQASPRSGKIPMEAQFVGLHTTASQCWIGPFASTIYSLHLNAYKFFFKIVCRHLHSCLLARREVVSTRMWRSFVNAMRSPDRPQMAHGISMFGVHHLHAPKQSMIHWHVQSESSLTERLGEGAARNFPDEPCVSSQSARRAWVMSVGAMRSRG